jgi:hypothetical protein
VKCYVCTSERNDRDAVGICTNCGAGLCAAHRNDPVVGPGGTAIGCRHRKPESERSAA